jgi:hypothetical protein
MATETRLTQDNNRPYDANQILWGLAPHLHCRCCNLKILVEDYFNLPLILFVTGSCSIAFQ